ncbi:MAG: endonuclease V [Methanomicrobiales archaeon]|nr:endonuclease V [Methanomicrobiales archaeon]
MKRTGLSRPSFREIPTGEGQPPPGPSPGEDNLRDLLNSHPPVDEGHRIQQRLTARIIIEDRLPRFPPRFIAGADAAYSTDGSLVFGAVAVLHCPDLSPFEVQCAERKVEFPYIPGMFAFREGPALLDAWRRLRTRPDLVIFHGHGIAHPEGCGLASHLGVLLDVPAIGVAGKPLGIASVNPGPLRGDMAPVSVGGRLVGCAVRTREGAREVYVSLGHRISLETAVRIVLATATRYRLPEPLRAAHRHAVACRAGLGKG